MKWRDIGVRYGTPWLAAAMVLLAGCSAVAHTPAPSVSATASGTPTATPTATPSVTGPAPITRTPSPRPSPSPPSPSALPVAPGAGRLKQTQAFPSTKTVAFRNAMHDLWLAVTAGKPRFALPAFFPEAAYDQLKAIAYPESDWQYRLWYDFTLDIVAVHDLLSKNAKLVQVIIPTEYAAWVYPGYCYNSIGYWHVPGARVVYREGSQVRSFGIASLISWRGDWYVIHFGAVLRGGGYGEVDDPAEGTGYPGPPGGCLSFMPSPDDE
jgi:hypothetical protein